jgi:hypothetical protein
MASSDVAEVDMKRLSLAFTTKDRVELSECSIKSLVNPDIDLWIFDGSTTPRGEQFVLDADVMDYHTRFNVRGGADRAIVYALTTLLQETYSEFIGICENDCLLHPDWFGPVLALFERGRADGLDVGAVSARCYADRILVQRDGHAVMHNLGAGHLILTRRAARLILDHYRSPWSTENRRVFQTLSGVDIARYWAFRGSQQFLTVDWGFDAVLARHGLASLALCPSPCEMIGQDISAQGLRLTTEPVEDRRDDAAFVRFVDRTRRIRDGDLVLNGNLFCQTDAAQLIFPHQIGALGGQRNGSWHTKWSQALGPFAYVAGEPSVAPPPTTVVVPVAGPCEFWVSGGGTERGRFDVTDTHSGYSVSPELPPDPNAVVQLSVPGFGYRDIVLTARTPGVVFYALAVHEPQPIDPRWSFDYSVLPPTV